MKGIAKALEVVLALAVGLLIIGGVWYFKLNSKASGSRLVALVSPQADVSSSTSANSSAPIAAVQKNARFLLNMSENEKQYTVAVYAPDETSSLIGGDGIDCGNDVGTEDYRGNYQLDAVWDNALIATTSIGAYEFNEATGASTLTLADPAVTFVVISQYGTCAGNLDFLYVMDSFGKFEPVTFIDQDGRIDDSVFVSDHALGTNGDLLSVGYYDNAGTSTVGNYSDTYRYEASGTRFVFVGSVHE